LGIVAAVNGQIMIRRNGDEYFSGVAAAESRFPGY
jgi:hypothetical protein